MARQLQELLLLLEALLLRLFAGILPEPFLEPLLLLHESFLQLFLQTVLQQPLLSPLLEVLLC